MSNDIPIEIAKNPKDQPVQYLKSATRMIAQGFSFEWVNVFIQLSIAESLILAAQEKENETT